MKYFYKLLLALLLLPNLMLAQNLVPNPSFEDTVACPSALGQINRAQGWYSAGGSPDFFHPCANSTAPNAGVPINISGNQQPFHNASYAGAFTYWDGVPSMREYLGIQLTQPLIIGSEYFVSAFISKGDTTAGLTNINCATNKFGFRFSTFKYDNDNLTPVPTDNYSHIYSDSVIYNSTGWTQLFGSFIADSAYSYLLLGNFYDDANTSAPGCNGIAYYYIDKVCVSTNPDSCDIILGTPSPKLKNLISLYPNPASSQLIVSNLDSNGTYLILSSTGRIIKSGSLDKTNPSIDVAKLSNGLYFLRLNNQYNFKFYISR